MDSQSHALQRILLVARDYKFPPLNAHLEAIAEIGEQHQADTFSFALSTLDRTRRSIELNRIFQSSQHAQYIMLESFRPAKQESEVDQRFHLVSRHGTQDFRRHFASSFESGIADKKAKLLAELPQRSFANAIILICGEISMLKVSHHDHQTIEDPLHFRDRLRPHQVIFAPAHSYMRRHEQKRKRQALSSHGRTVISVWNKNSYIGRESTSPWTIYRNGDDITMQVKPITHAIEKRPDIQLGIIEL